MSQLSDVRIADLCRLVGFGRPDLYDAIATAVAASGGRPGYEHVIRPGPVAVYKGLWGVDLCEHDDVAGVDLSDPWQAAQTALELTHKHGGFGWCPAYRSSAHLPYLGRAEVAWSMIPGREPVHEPIGFYHARHALDAHLERLGNLHTAMHDHLTRKAQ